MVSTAVRTLLVVLVIFLVWQIGVLTTNKPEQLVPRDIVPVINKNPLFIYSYKEPKTLLFNCTIEPYLENFDGLWVANVTASSRDYVLMYPEQKLPEGERLTSGFLRTCYLKLFSTETKEGMLLFHNKYLVKKYDVGDSEYSPEVFNDIISSYSDLSVAIRKMKPPRTSPLFKKF